VRDPGAARCRSVALSIVISSNSRFTRKDEPMRYTLLLHYPEMTAEELGEDALKEGMAAFDGYAKALEDAGVLLSAEVLAPSSATTTISRKTGELLIQDGPFADTKEQHGGTFVIEVPDLNAAIAWAERAPSALYGDVEIRPTATRFVDGAWTEWTFPGT
jgi:hypothetical protein